MSNFEQITPMSQAGAADFYRNGMNQLDNLLIGESEAKMGTLVTMAAGVNNVLVGHPGGGKTTLGEDAYRLIEGINADNVAILPVQADLQPQQIVGGEARTKKVSTFGEDEPLVEENVISIKSLFNEDTKVIFANEINRVNPMAINAMLEVLESGKVDHTGGRSMLDLEYATSTMNPAEKRQGVFTMAAAIASRHAIGVELGADDRNGERDNMIHEVLGGWEPRPNAVEPIIDLKDLQALRARISGTGEIAFPEPLKAEAVTAIKNTHEELKGLGIVEADARLAKQVAKVARGIAALRGQAAIEKDDLKQAVNFVVGARIGILGTGTQTVSAKEVTNQVFAQ